MRGGGRFGKDYKQRLAVARTKKKQETYSSPPPKEEKPSYNRFARGGVDRQPSVFNRVEDAAKGFGQQTATDFALGLTNPVYKLAETVGAPEEGFFGKERFLRQQAQLFTGFGSLAPEEEFISRVKEDTKDYSGKELANDLLASYANFVSGAGMGAKIGQAATKSAQGALRGMEAMFPRISQAALTSGGRVVTNIPDAGIAFARGFKPYGATASQTANISKASTETEDWWNLPEPSKKEIEAANRQTKQEAIVSPGEDIAAAWSRGEFEPAFATLENAWKTRKGNTTTIDNVPPAIVEALSRGIRPDQIRFYADDIIRGAGDPSMAKAGQRIEIVWSRDPKKDVDQFLRVRTGGAERTAKVSNVEKKWLAEGTEKIKAEDAVAEFNKFRKQTDMPSEVRVYNEKGDVVQYLHPHIDHFMSASAVGAYAKLLRQQGKNALADKMIKAANTRENMLVYYAPDNVTKGRISPDVWEKQLESAAPQHYGAVHGEGTYAGGRYAEAREHWRKLIGDDEYSAFMDWYNAESLKTIKGGKGASPDLYPEQVSPLGIFGEMAKALQGK